MLAVAAQVDQRRPRPVRPAVQVDAVVSEIPPNVVEVITKIMQSGRDENFEFGLDLILDGLEKTLTKTRPPNPSSDLETGAPVGPS